MKKILCPYCKQPAEWVENKAIYGRNYGRSYMMWLCRPCDAYVGCHNNSKKPLGTLANKETRDARKAAHAVIDPLWKSGRHTRKDVYRTLRRDFGREIHVGESDIAQCQAIIDAVRRLYAQEKEAARQLSDLREQGLNFFKK